MRRKWTKRKKGRREGGGREGECDGGLKRHSRTADSGWCKGRYGQSKICLMTNLLVGHAQLIKHDHLCLLILADHFPLIPGEAVFPPHRPYLFFFIFAYQCVCPFHCVSVCASFFIFMGGGSLSHVRFVSVWGGNECSERVKRHCATCCLIHDLYCQREVHQ